MANSDPVSRVAVIGAGVAGAACAASLQRGGCEVVLFDKSRGVGGRMATRRARWMSADGTEHDAEFDHGAQDFGARHPRFRATLERLRAAGCVATWQPRVHRASPALVLQARHVAQPNMPALCRQLIGGTPLRLGHAVQRLQRAAEGWQVVTATEAAGPFDQVVLAMPPAQAALLLAGHHDTWAEALCAVPVAPCWTLMAVTDEVDWPWDAAEPASGPLAWVARNDRKPGRAGTPGHAIWVAQATQAWSAAHLEDDAAIVTDALCEALQAQLPGGRRASRATRWQHRSVHRWRYAVPAGASPDGLECWWDGALGLGVCGDFLGGGGVEAAWRSGDELADTLSAWLEVEHPLAAEAA